MSIERPRQIAVELLSRGEGTNTYFEDRLEERLDRERLHTPDRALCRELACGVLRRRSALDWIIARFARQAEQREPLQSILRVALFQVFFLDRIPPHAAVHQAVQQAREMGFGPQSGFINALLRQALREQEAVRKGLENLELSDPARAFSHPDWLVQRWIARLGAEATRTLLASNNRPARVYARVNTLKTTATALVDRWRAEGVDYDFRAYDWTGENLVFLLKQFPPLASLGSFREGGFYIQDPSTLLATAMLDPQPGETILDLCAAPGGKTTHIAQRMLNQGRIVAQDRAFDRLPLIRENCARLGVTIAHASKADGVVFPELNVAFDRVLVDAPCSNTGVIRRRLDLRYRIRPEEITRLQSEQAEILDHAAALLKRRGVLVYSTCSIEPEENRMNVDAFLQRHIDFALEAERELIPGRDDCDGAYAAKLVRT